MGICFGTDKGCFGQDKPESHIKELDTSNFPKSKLDPKDFMISKKENETIIREPGSVNGQQFIIEDCVNCDIYILDNSAAISIDYCVGCRIYIGPCESSVFVRNCDDCSMIVATAQFRTCECKNLRLLLLSTTAPSIETTDMQIGCYDFSYFALASQCEAAGVSPWNNKWSQVHNYTPSAGKWSTLPTTTRFSDLLKPLPDDVAERVGFSVEEDARIVPITTGNSKARVPAQCCFAVVFADHIGRAHELVRKVNMLSGGPSLLQAKQMFLAPDMVNTLFEDDELARQGNRGGEVLGLEWKGAQATQKVYGVVAEMSLSAHDAVFLWNKASDSHNKASHYFDLWKDEM